MEHQIYKHFFFILQYPQEELLYILRPAIGRILLMHILRVNLQPVSESKTKGHNLIKILLPDSWQTFVSSFGFF